MISVGFFSEMKLYADNGSIKEHIIEEVDYDKTKVVDYLKSQKRMGGCPRAAIDCLTGDIITPSFSVYTDGEYEWCDFLLYHINKYNIKLPQKFIEKIGA